MNFREKEKRRRSVRNRCTVRALRRRGDRGADPTARRAAHEGVLHGGHHGVPVGVRRDVLQGDGQPGDVPMGRGRRSERDRPDRRADRGTEGDRHQVVITSSPPSPSRLKGFVRRPSNPATLK